MSRTRLIVLSGAVAGGLAAATAWALEIPLDRAIVLAPALVVGFGLLAMVGALLVRALLDSLRRSRNPRLVLWLWAGAVALVAVLTVLGVELPRE